MVYTYHDIKMEIDEMCGKNPDCYAKYTHGRPIVCPYKDLCFRRYEGADNGRAEFETYISPAVFGDFSRYIAAIGDNFFAIYQVLLYAVVDNFRKSLLEQMALSPLTNSGFTECRVIRDILVKPILAKPAIGYVQQDLLNQPTFGLDTIKIFEQ